MFIFYWYIDINIIYLFIFQSTTDLRLNLSTIGTQLSIIEDTLPFNKVDSKIKQTDMKHIRDRKKFVGKNDCVPNKSSIRSKSSLFTFNQPYNPNKFTDFYDDSCSSNTNNNLIKVDESIFVSDLGKSVAGIYNHSDFSAFDNDIEPDVLCEHAEKEMVKKIRDELKKWKREYFLKTRQNFKDPLLEISCGKFLILRLVLINFKLYKNINKY